MALAACGQANGAPLAAPSTPRTANAPVSTAPASVPEVSVPSPGSLAPLVEAVKGAVVNVEVQSRPRVASREDLPFPPGLAERFGFPGMPRGQTQGPVQQGLGSGFLIDDKGTVLTNNHVVEGADHVRVKLEDGRAFDAEVLGRDPLTDVALLHLKGAPNGLPFVALGDSDTTRVGDFLVAIGNPFGLASSVSSGILSARARDIHSGPYDDFLQTDAAINPGNSGGPLFNLKGEVIGMNTAIIRDATGIGFAVPSNLIRSLLPQLEKAGAVRRGWLGLSVQDLTPELGRALGLNVDKGAIVANVNPGSPGAKAGLHDDDVITEVEGKPITSAGTLTRTVGLLQPDSRVKLHVLREGKPLDVQVTLGTRPALDGEPEVTPRDGSAAPAQQRLGLRLMEDPEGNGARVAAVEPGSPADRADIPAGALLRQVGNHKVASAAEAADLLRSASSGTTLLLRIQPPNADVTLLRALTVP
ncbi:peptidase S1 [Vitiosangium sp. GDMCC 1.1324]|nr:trypsin-like peptidase domain-containing protein [Vitiosangium sp. GDMCC 1.1324]PTL76347.1 peptidase S1 [Vitiosangium sp. GDMCC 1.1324]